MTATAGGHGGGAPRLRRAPRLAPDERIAPYLTRAGRFARIDPLTPRPLPPGAVVLAILGWAGLLLSSFLRARRQG